MSIAGLMMYVSKRYIMFDTESICRGEWGYALRCTGEECPLLVVAACTCVYLNAFWNDGVGGGHLEGALQEADDAPDGNHDENGDDAVKHDLQAFAFLVPRIDEVSDETPEEDDDGERDKEPH